VIDFAVDIFFIVNSLPIFFQTYVKSDFTKSFILILLLLMLKNYFTVALRSLRKQKGLTFINIMGLAIGLTSFLLISLYILDELSYDAFHRNAENIYRISYTQLQDNGNTENRAIAGPIWSTYLKQNYPEVLKAVRFTRFPYPGSITYKKKDLVFLETDVYWADSNYTEMFNLPLINGNPAEALKLPNAVVITQTVAKKYFGDADPIGETFTYSTFGQNLDLIVTGVMKDFPANSHFKPDFLANMESISKLIGNGPNGDWRNQWSPNFIFSYVLLDDKHDINKLQAGLTQALKKNIGEDAKYFNPFFTKLTDIHFTPGLLWDLESAGDIKYIYIFGSISILIVLIACINYMNLATARSAKRAKEVGLRKTVGGTRQQLMVQFFNESLLMTGISLLLTLGLLLLCMPLFNNLTGKQFTWWILLDSRLWALLLAVALLVSLVAGSYPALYLSNFKPIEVLKGKITSGRGAETFRKSLVVFQFAISILMLICTGIVLNQLNYIQDAKLSQYKDQVLSVRYFGVAQTDKYSVVRDKLLQNPAVAGVTAADHLPRQEHFGKIETLFTFLQQAEKQFEWSKLSIDEDFTNLFDLELLAGRNFSRDNPTDSNNFIINERAVKDLGLTTEQAIGYTIFDTQDSTTGQIVGVVKDFNYKSMHSAIGPLAMNGKANSKEILYVKLNTNNFKSTLESLEKTWKDVYPASPFERWFLDEEFDKMYVKEQRMAEVFSSFSILAIIIACLGLFGLASFSAEQRTKEIGIRKVLGASTVQVVVLLVKTFAILFVIAFLIAAPVAFYTMHQWLQNFTYHAGIQWWVFLLAGLLVFTITLLTVSYESVKASLANPVKSIKHE
jgi:putative ABC transport system permease protein